MKNRQKYLISVVFTIVAIALILTNFTYTAIAVTQDNLKPYYREKSIHNPDGIGKYYMKREIAQVMGHQAVMWLERAERETEEQLLIFSKPV